MSSLRSIAKRGCGGVFDFTILDERPGILVFRASGKDAAQLFAHESGGHRWQRVPETEKRGRVQTSTVTVAVLQEAVGVQVRFDPRDVEIKTCRGSGAGGQHRNKTETAIQATHLPSGLSVRCEGERSQRQNKDEALRLLQARLQEQARVVAFNGRAQDRKDQVGSGQRGDKVRTIAVQRDQVVHHETGKSTTYQRYRKGHLEDLW
jgi:peptide chain release factor 1